MCIYTYHFLDRKSEFKILPTLYIIHPRSLCLKRQNIQLNSHQLKSENYTPDEESKRSSRMETSLEEGLEGEKKTVPHNPKLLFFSFLFFFFFLPAIILWEKYFTFTGPFSFL